MQCCSRAQALGSWAMLLRNCSPSAGTASCRISMACPGHLFRGAGLKVSPGQLPSPQPPQDETRPGCPGKAGGRSAMPDPSLGPARKWGTQVLTVNSCGDLGSVTRAYCRGEQLGQVQDCRPPKAQPPLPRILCNSGLGGEEGPAAPGPPKPRGHENALLCGLLEAPALQVSS